MYDLVQNWIIAATGFSPERVFRMRQGGPRPAVEYITYYLVSSHLAQRPLKSMVDAGHDDDVVVTYVTVETAVYGVDVHSVSGDQVLNILDQSRSVLAPRQILRAHDVTLIKKGVTRDFSVFGDTKWRFRFQADFTFLKWAMTSEFNQRVLSYEIHWVFDSDECVMEE